MNPNVRSPDDIERLRRHTILGGDSGKIASHYLADVALDGLRFRFWIMMAEQKPSAVARALAPCRTMDEHRAAIDKMIVDHAQGNL